MTNIGEDEEKLEPSYPASGSENGTAALGKRLLVPKKHSYQMTQQFHS